MVAKKNNTTGPEVVMEYDNEVKSSVAEAVVKKPKVAKKASVTKKKPKKKVEKREKSAKVKNPKNTPKSKKKIREEKLKEDIEAPIDESIQLLLDSGRTFVDNITRNAKKSVFSSFYPFPKNTSLISTEKDEVVVLMVRHHWAGLIPRGILALFTILLPFLLATATDSWFDSVFSVIIFNTGMFIFFSLLALSVVVDGFFKWFFQVNVITTSRVIDVDFVSIMTHRLSETTFDQIQDVSHSPGGPLASVFDYGDVFLQTAGSQNEFHFCNIPRPRDVQDTIFDLRYLRKKYFIDMHK